MLLTTFAVLLASALAHEYPDCSSEPLSNNSVCDTSLSARERAQALIDAMTIQEKLNLTHNNSPGVPRLGLPTYNWWGEALHGVAAAPAIVMAAAFDDPLIYSIGEVISTEARAFSNANKSGLDYWTPNINPFRDPRWGRGQETPGEDTYVVKRYIENMVTALQGGPEPETYKIIATCKHYTAYDMEFWQGNTRYGYDAKVSAQDMAEYYMQPFQQCARDTKVGSIMCAYNSVNGVPSCANSYTIESVLRGHWNWTADENYITSDCTAIQNIYTDHHAFPDRQQTVAAALNSGVDIDCGYYNPTFLPSAYEQGLFEEATLDRSLLRLYTALVKSGYFNSAESQPWRSLGWSNVSTPESEDLALQIAEEGLVLLKNDGTLPLSLPSEGNLTVLLIGGWFNATSEMQGIYAGPARTLVSPWMALNNMSNINIETIQWYESPLIKANELQPDVIVWIDATHEGAEETADRNTIKWDLMQPDAVESVATTGIPTVVVHMGEQCDDSMFFSNANVSAVLWAGYPGMFGGQAIINTLFGEVAPAGRMPITQYPTNYVNEVAMTDMGLRPDSETGNPGRTYKWYDNATVEFGFGLHYTNFTAEIIAVETTSFDIAQLPHARRPLPLPSRRSSSTSSLEVNVTNTGNTTSDYVALAFVAGEYGPEPRPRKSLVAYQRLKGVESGASQTGALNITLGALARYDVSGNEILYPGSYRIQIDVPVLATWEFELTGAETVLDHWPQS
ncbi:putative exo-1,4-beta-xylosidase bxlB [Cyphellophora attinorum]|uniref:xylan 1,4-beta-xylosidase n=1 Tax=Cyphellophora attinorum TaxID=1664694 RepID=A0A0N1H9R8_9EURO|nr:putative exo-1,4-beta-xylosidase bxlB [Phialophora attinorum]KPI44493.1 putative exo-1,4-beta-xylosidase bxlB [Phialophora attinorum]